MSSPQYLISQKALADLEAIWRYTAETWSVPQADRYYQLIIDEIEFLAHHPRQINPWIMSARAIEHPK